ncbi:MAG TPA: hemolysin family protein [Alphaproteobacteria bacterium]|nr:hemolysin family protein [Alphaproteobacteria bacterium]
MRRRDNTLRETIEEFIEERQENAEPIAPDERMLANILSLRDHTAYDVMVPRADIVAVPADLSLDDLIAAFVTEGHSRLPVYRETLDDVIGMVHIKDALTAFVERAAKPFKLSDIVRDVLIVAPSMPVLDLLLDMRQRRTHMALVVDEFGGIDGLITIEDLVEEIVGEINDEHDLESEPELVERPDGTLIADARVSIERFEERLGDVLSEEERDDIDTLGGLVASLAGRVPARGELLRHASGIEFEVLDADPRRVKRLRVRPVPATPAEGQRAQQEAE